jgi:hypothetical protein
MGSGLPALSTRAHQRVVLDVRPVRLFQGRPGVALPLRGLIHRIFALFAENIHLVEADSRQRPNLR